MIFSINAWLDRPNPYICIVNRTSGSEVARFDEKVIEELFRKGDFVMHDFYQTDNMQQKHLVQKLLLFKCCTEAYFDGPCLAEFSGNK